MVKHTPSQNLCSSPCVCCPALLHCIVATPKVRRLHKVTRESSVHDMIVTQESNGILARAQNHVSVAKLFCGLCPIMPIAMLYAEDDETNEE